jgi:chaperonin cofactor prefoldin
MDAIHFKAYKNMRALLTEKEEFFNKEIAGFKKEQSSLEKKLEKLETPPEPPKMVIASPSKKKGE